MTPAERGRSGCDGKEVPCSLTGDVITYKRRRRDSGGLGGVTSLGSESEITRLLQDSSFSNEAVEPDKLKRITEYWRNSLESLTKVSDVCDDECAKYCILKALKCSPFGVLKQADNGSVQTEGSSKRNGEIAVEVVGSPSTRRLLRSSKENTKISLDGMKNSVYQSRENTIKCQNALSDILASEKFALLCDLVCENFETNKLSHTFGMSLIFSQMKNGIYEQSIDLFDKDIQLIWEKYQRIGQEMALLASTLSSISQVSYQTQVGKTPGSLPVTNGQAQILNEVFDSVQLAPDCVTKQQSTKESARDANCVESDITVLDSRESDPSTKAEPVDPSCLYKVSTCYCCGLEADGKKSLICDGCESMLHVSCIKPPMKEIPKRAWYCATCLSSRGKSTLLNLTRERDHSHLNCVVCERLNGSGLQAKMGLKSDNIHVLNNRSRECSVSSKECEELIEPSRTASLHLCKQCGTCDDDDKIFIICSNKQCLYKYYHIQCLKSTQLASEHQPRDRWYCPSCLCRGCLVDKDDDLICLCDACDEGYHIYCMKPPQTTVPKGSWYCFPCNMERAKKGRKMYEQSVLQTHGKNGVKCGKRPLDEKSGGEATMVAGSRRNA